MDQVDPPHFVCGMAFGIDELYVWAGADTLQHDALLTQKAPYLNVGFFLVRSAVYLLAGAALTGLLSKWSRSATQARSGLVG